MIAISGTGEVPSEKPHTAASGWHASKTSEAFAGTGMNALLRREGYEPEEVLGEGAFGQVLLVEHKELKIEYACKRLKKEAVNEQWLDTEVAILKACRHANIVFLREVLSGTSDDDEVFLILELARGGSLMEKIDAEHGLPESYAASVIIQLSSALDYLHSRDIFAAHFQHVFYASMELNLTAVFDGAEITRPKPAVNEALLILLWRLVVAIKHAVAPQPDLTALPGRQGVKRVRVHNFSLKAWHGLPAGSEPCFKGLIGVIECDHAACFGETIGACLDRLWHGCLELREDIGWGNIVEPPDTGEIS